MKELLTGNSLWVLVKQSDVVTKIVLLILLFMSIGCWAIFFYKVIMFRIKRKHMVEALSPLKRAVGIDDLVTLAGRYAHTLPGYVISKSLIEFKRAVQGSEEIKGAVATQDVCDKVVGAVDQVIGDLVSVEESYLPFLSVSAAISPLLGLFGTIWGLVDSFVKIGQMQSADIATVAPGIAEALITTLAGLMVAIPALVMYHYCINQVRWFERQMYVYADQIDYVMRNLCIKDK
jgi:biopolymer transport protein TolQ